MNYGPVERATRAELRTLGVSVRTSILAASAVSLARNIDTSRGAVAAAAASLQLRQTRAELIRELKGERDSDVDNALAALAAELGGGLPSEVEHPAH
jgi:hypothetical protein